MVVCGISKLRLTAAIERHDAIMREMSTQPVFRIRSEDKARVEVALSLLTKVLGEGLYTLEALRKIADDADSILLGCLADGRLAGTAMAGKLKNFGMSFYSPFGTEALELLSSHKIGVLRNSAVEESCRGQGLGKALLLERLQWLESVDCNYAIGLTWLHGKTGQSDRLYRAAGFDQIGSIVPSFFKSLSERTGMRCPYCGFPCVCSAAMFAKKL